MNEQEVQQLNKKLAEFAGFKEIVCTDDYDVGDFKAWKSPDGNIVNLPNFPKSLDACEKWVIYPNRGGLNNPPSSRILNWSFSNRQPHVGTYSMPRVWLSYCTLLDKGKNIWSKWQTSYAENDSLALALCLAIEKLIDSEATK